MGLRSKKELRNGPLTFRDNAAPGSFVPDTPSCGFFREPINLQRVHS
jgi:hypothetical protein